MIDIFKQLRQEAGFLQQKCLTDNDKDLWSSRMSAQLNRIINDNGEINKSGIKNFRQNLTFINEHPGFSSLYPYNFLIGSRRAQIKFLKERLQVMNEVGDIHLLEKYPINMVGNPNVIPIKGYDFNRRWSNNLRYLSLSLQYLGNVLSHHNSSLLDLGGGYGIFPSLLKQEFNDLKLAIVEFPEQLLLAYYFLASTFPDARINSFEEVYDVEVIDKEFINQYDFVLIPIDCYKKIEKGAFTVLSNFFSLGEMSEEWFDIYTKGDAFQGADYILTINRFESRPSYNTMLNILDYNLEQYEKIHFQISPYERYHYERKYLFFYKKEYYTSQFFEFIGKRKA